MGSLPEHVLVALGFLIRIFSFSRKHFCLAIIEIRDRAESHIVRTLRAGCVIRCTWEWLVTFSGVRSALGSWWGLFTIIPITLVIV